MKKCVIVYNPNSGKGQMLKYLDNFKQILNENDYEVTFEETKYSKHAIKIIKSLSNDVDLVISAGGDGTFNEVVTGNFERKNRLLLSHIPIGTTNDVGVMFGYGKDPLENLKLLMNGEKHNIDICLINNQPFDYVAGFGAFLDIPYATPRELKKKIGYLAYVLYGIREVFKKIPMYNLTYRVNGEEYRGKYSLMLITNANRVAGFNNLYKDVKLDDNEFEVLICNLPKRIHFLKAIYMLKTDRVTQAPGVYYYRTNKLEIEFNKPIKNNWCIDGEMFDKQTTKYVITIDKELKILMPRKNVDKLFTKKWYNLK